MGRKVIIMDVMHETAEIKIETEGFIGHECKEKSKFLKDALGKVIADELKSVYYEEKETVKEKLIPLCG